MNLQQYTPLAIKTCKPLSYDLHMMHMIAGIAGETFEYEELVSDAYIINDDESVKKEMGDICWYLAGLCFQPIGDDNMFIQVIHPQLQEGEGINTDIGNIIETIKKHVIYEKDLPLDQLESLINKGFSYIKNECETFNFDFQEVLDININKLKTRYPDAYSNESAINRVDQ